MEVFPLPKIKNILIAGLVPTDYIVYRVLMKGTGYFTAGLTAKDK
jgi:hypothetical protein